MSIGMILLLVLALLILFGVLQRVLDRMALTDRQALILVAAIFIGGWLPDLRIGMVSLNIGGALVPLGVCVYLFFHAGAAKERIRALVASVLTAAVIYVISLFFPADPVTMPFDPMILYGLCGGIIAWLLGAFPPERVHRRHTGRTACRYGDRRGQLDARHSADPLSRQRGRAGRRRAFRRDRRDAVRAVRRNHRAHHDR